MAQLLMQGTNYVNFIGRYCWVAAGEHGFDGGRRHRARRAAGGHRQHAARAGLPRRLQEARRARRHAGARPRAPRHATSATSLRTRSRKPEVLQVQTRGEYLYAACGEGGLRVFDIAFIDDKAFSERITTAPVSPLGPAVLRADEVRHRRRRADARSAPDPTRTQHPGEPASSRSTRCTATSTSPTSTRA